MNKRVSLLVAFCGLALAGCFTVHETDYPQVVLNQVSGDMKVSVEGFLAQVTTYTPVYTSQTVLVGGGPGWYGPYGGPGPHIATVNGEMLIPQVQTTDAYVKRMQGRLEEAGCILRSMPKKYTVSGEFSGPYNPPGANFRRVAIDLGSVLFADYDTAGYQLNVKVYEVSTGKALFASSYNQEFSSTGFSPLWIFGLAAYENNTTSYMQSWCMNALVDRAAADVSAFLSKLQ